MFTKAIPFSQLTEHLANFKTGCVETKKLYGSERLDSDYVFITANLEAISSGYIVEMFHAFPRMYWDALM